MRREHYILAKQVNIEFTMFTKKRDGRQEGVRRITGKEDTEEIRSYILTERINISETQNVLIFVQISYHRKARLHCSKP